MKAYKRSSSFSPENSCEDVVKHHEKLLNIERSCAKETEETSEWPFDFKPLLSVTREIDEVEYVAKSSFEFFSRKFQTWADHRLKVIKILEKESRKLESIRKYAIEGRLISSCLDIVGTFGALVLRNIQPEWESTALIAASACSSIGLISSVAEVTISQQTFADAIKLLREDQQKLKRMTDWFRSSNPLNKFVQNLFPHGIDTELVKRIQSNHSIEKEYRSQFSKLRSTLPTILKKTSRECTNDEAALSLKLFLAILMSNSKKNLSILDDEQFLSKAWLFTSNIAAQIWWNKIKIEDDFLIVKSIGKHDLISQINLLKKEETIFDHTVPIFLTLPFLRLHSMPSGSILLLNTLAAYSSYSELNQHVKNKASRVLKQLAEALKKDFELMSKIYDMMNPNSEYNMSQRTKGFSFSSPFY